MFKTKFINYNYSIYHFLILTSTIKNETRVIEKKYKFKY